ncbi:MAG TPA: rhodanese-like domain-containing protein [Edaphobacter sp.]
MTLIICAVGVVLGLGIIGGIVMMRRSRDRREFEHHYIEPDTLYELLSGGRKIHIFDVRQPLDLLAYAEIIPGATRIPPKDVIANPSLIPKEEEAVVYCTCNSEKTSRDILRRALALEFSRIKLLRGGLAAWKAKGYSVESYTESFHLDTAT